MTSVGVLADNEKAQQRLPQFLMGSSNVLPVRDVAAVAAALPQNIRIVLARSSWTHLPFMVQLMRRVRQAVARAGASWQVIVVTVCAQQRIDRRVCEAAAPNGIWAACVPAKPTWLLQPPGTHVFVKSKRRMAEECASECVRAPDGVVTYVRWLLAVGRTTWAVLESRGWEVAFAETGCTNNRSQRPSFLLPWWMVCGTLLPASVHRPTGREVGVVLPGCAGVQANIVFRGVDRCVSARSEAVPSLPPEAAAQGRTQTIACASGA